MNKTELIAAVAEKAEISKKDAEKAIKAFTEAVSEELVKGGKIQLGKRGKKPEDRRDYAYRSFQDTKV